MTRPLRSKPPQPEHTEKSSLTKIPIPIVGLPAQTVNLRGQCPDSRQRAATPAARRLVVLALVGLAFVDLAFVGLAVAACGQPSAVLPRRPWPRGEELQYSLRFGPISAGTAVLRAEGPVAFADRACWRLSLSIATGRAMSMIYRVRDHLESVADTTDLRCLHLETRVQEGAYRERLEADIDHARGVITYTSGRCGRVVSGCHDILAAWYRVRCLALAVADTCALPVMISGGAHTLHLTVANRVHAETPLGPRACLVVDAWLDGLAPGRAGRELRLVVTDDPARLPVRVEVSTPAGTMAAVLQRIATTDLPESE